MLHNPIHHIELWTDDLAAAHPGWSWLFLRLGWREGDRWKDGQTWHHPAGPYVVLEQSSALHAGGHDRMRAGLNHLAINASSRAQLDTMRVDARGSGWFELFAEKYPHAGGPDHTALFLENDHGFEVEVVLPTDVVSGE